MKQLAGANAPQLSEEVIGKLRTYNWPGNVRQLRNCLERAILLSNEGRITTNELPPEVARTNGAMPFSAGPIPLVTAPAGDSAGGSASGSLRDVEKQQII